MLVLRCLKEVVGPFRKIKRKKIASVLQGNHSSGSPAIVRPSAFKNRAWLKSGCVSIENDLNKVPH